MSVADPAFLNKVAQSLADAPESTEAGAPGSILVVAAASYGARPADDENTIPTGFDPLAAALFEAVVEAAFLVANADGDFDAEERKAFSTVVLQATKLRVDARQIDALLADLAELFDEDGLDTRIKMISRTVTKPHHQREVLRVASLLAHVSGGVSDVERSVLEKLAHAFDLDGEAVSAALEDAKTALGQ